MMQNTASPSLRIGCAGWSLPREQWPHFPDVGSHLERYAARFGMVEVNSSFYRPHRFETYARWAASTPAGFRFAVKLPKAITHERQLADAMPLCDEFLGQVGGLGEKLGCVLAQLAPRMAFDAATAERFFADLRNRHGGRVALEPRHASWFTPEADALLARHRIGRVLADPVLHDAAVAPGGWPGLVYVRMHGTPRVYWSAYDDALLARVAQRLRQAQAEGAECWCILDNTASGAAVANALTLARLAAESFSQPPTETPSP